MAAATHPRHAPIDDAFVITRTFAAPRDVVWNAWTETERLAQWWGPKGCTIRVVTHDLRVGGIFHYAMEYKTGAAMWGRFTYREIAAPERLVFVNAFSDANGGLARAPFKEVLPLEMLINVTFREVDGHTAITLRSTPLNATAEERQGFIHLFPSMQQGYSGTFDQLDRYLAASRQVAP
jgi:uncharacterized protein YndB with AHSA1/START domain